MSKRIIAVSTAIAVVIIIIISFNFREKGDFSEIVTELERGSFEITVVNSGELEAINSTPIMGPLGLVSARLWSVQIEDIVEEGTMVKKGDYVATLDRTEISQRIQNEELDVEESVNSLEQAQIDSALDLRGRRDELKKKLLNVERKKLELKNSQYEPPATIQQAELALREAEMDYELAVEDYNLRKEKAESMVRRRDIELRDDQRYLNLLLSLNEQFIIRAPDNGLVIYHKDRGVKVKKGSNISARDPIVASLPDLSKMQSICYVNEIDIRLLNIGQRVRVGIDAFPDKKLTGVVRKIANVGEALPAGEAKVFEVLVEINEADPDLKPGMTTSNEIIIRQEPDVLALPLECLHSLGDSLNYVFLKKALNTVRKEIKIGESNTNHIIIREGLNEGDKVLMNIPPNADKLQLDYLN